MEMQKRFAVVECPRDAMQGWKTMIPATDKIRYINALLQVGFDTIDFGSFVSPKAIPQMADTKEVLSGLDLGGTTSRLLAIVANQRGAEEAVLYDAIGDLGFPFSISPTFQQRNTNSTIQESLKRVDDIQNLCIRKRKQLVIYLSMGFGNPYGDPYDEKVLFEWADAMVSRGVTTLSLADTVGVATPEQISLALKALIPKYPDVTVGVHLHSRSDNWEAKLAGAFHAGCTRFDGALKGIGGCPMAQDSLVGNMNTENILHYLGKQGVSLGINKEALARSLQIAAEIFI